MTARNFAMTGAAGFVAPRHLKAIQDTGNRLVAAVDPHDAVGILDRFGLDVAFFTEFERFDRHLEKRRRSGEAERVHFVSVCSPNYLHDAHIRLALRVGADAICEKPLVINPWNLDALGELERETGRTTYTVLQLRLHPDLVAAKAKLVANSSRRHQVRLHYVTARGRWYDVSWKGSPERSGGVIMNIGIHFFDLLMWLFGDVQTAIVTSRDDRKASGILQLTGADVQWSLSTDANDLPDATREAGRSTFRSINIDGESLEFSEGFTDLHTRVYSEILAGRGFKIDDARPSIELAHRMRTAPISSRTP
jgi:UDP-N-acetyl-2-amino-2-deoxyglucuronate dehydrogenase